jgi:hypothetical protein
VDLPIAFLVTSIWVQVVLLRHGTGIHSSSVGNHSRSFFWVVLVKLRASLLELGAFLVPAHVVMGSAGDTVGLSPVIICVGPVRATACLTGVCVS